ncbi:hypothetical protein SDC9_152435 [bioreactor metagenome]|uniref:Uncharacterized protein n=1 Tax=bioreactor metagenome TaxID=1076179 RepID=A0A645ET33_9ZZZZ
MDITHPCGVIRGRCRCACGTCNIRCTTHGGHQGCCIRLPCTYACCCSYKHRCPIPCSTVIPENGKVIRITQQEIRRRRLQIPLTVSKDILFTFLYRPITIKVIPYHIIVKNIPSRGTYISNFISINGPNGSRSGSDNYLLVSEFHVPCSHFYSQNVRA